MKLEIDVVSSVSIKRKKPWPKLAWIGKEQEGIYLVDERRVSQLYLPSGKTKKKIAKLHNFMNDICAVNVSQCGKYLIGILREGKVFLWEKDKDIVKFITGLPKLFNLADKENAKNKIFCSSCGKFLLVMVGFHKVFLWQKDEKVFSDEAQDLSGTWCQIHRGDYVLPDTSNKETAVDGVFYYDQITGSCGCFSYVFNHGTSLTITTLSMKYHGATSQADLVHELTNQDDDIVSREVTEQTRFSIKWHTVTRPLYHLTPATRLVKGRFVYVCRYSPDGQVLAVVLNQKYAKDTRLLFSSPLHGTMTVVDLKCCGSSGRSGQSSGRAWWISEIVWTNDSLLLLGVTRSGALFITSKLGEPLNLVTSGCMMDIGPRLFIPLHPRITIRSFQENIPPDNSDMSTGSERDAFHQKFSVAVHPRFPVFLCSDGYIVTILQFKEKPGYVELMTHLVQEVSHLIPRDTTAELMVTPGILKKSPEDHVQYSTVLSSMATQESESSSPGSTLSASLPGLGIVSNVESGVVIFGEVGHQETRSEEVAAPENEQDKYMKAKHLLFQALGIGTCCGAHWSPEMTVPMNLVIHAWAKLFCCLLEHSCKMASQPNSTVSFHSIVSFFESILELFHWDKSYQHCLPWLSQVASAAVKSLVTFQKFDQNEVINVAFRLLGMVESCINQVYTWCSSSDRCSVHLLGDRYLPICEATCSAIIGEEDHSAAPAATYLECKLERAWLVLHNYVCQIYQSNPDEQLAQNICLIQEKLQNINSVRHLVSIGKEVSLFDQGQRLYLEGKVSHAVNILRKSVNANTQKNRSEVVKRPTTSKSVKKEGCNSVDREVNIVRDFSSQVDMDRETLLTILHIYLENYDLKAALALVYCYLNTDKPVSMDDCLYGGSSVMKGPLLFAHDGSEASITSSSPSVQLQLLLLTRYPLAWVTDNCALAVVQHLARFMCCYFTNLPLTIPVPFECDPAALWHYEQEMIESEAAVGTMKTLLQQKVTDAVSKQKLDQCWTADHAIQLLIVSGLLDEAAWFSERLGDWKIAFFLSIVHEFHNRCHQDVYQLPRAQCLFPFARNIVEPKQLIVTKIKLTLHLDNDWGCAGGDSESYSDENVVKSLRDFFQASVLAGIDIVPDCLENLLYVLLENIRNLGWLVAHDFYLPAPPLYCPQPTRSEEEVINDEMKREILTRNKIAKIVEKFLVVVRSCNCFLWCAQVYCSHIASRAHRGREHDLPSVVKEFLASDNVHFDQERLSQDNEATSSSCQGYPDSTTRVLQSFQQFCGLMWLLDVRDNVSFASRAYSKLKQSLVVGQDDRQNEVIIEKCHEALESLKRMLPFSEFLRADHDVQDGMLTMLAELPLTIETVDTLAEYFHTPPESLGLSTLDKLKRLTRRLKNVPSENGESLFTVYQDKCKARRIERKVIVTNHSESEVFSSGDAFEYCSSVCYEETSEYLHFLDTFLLIVVSKHITKSDHREIPLIMCCAEQLELTTLPDRTTMTTQSPGLQRSQSFHDMRCKGRVLPQKNDGDQNVTMYRSNSLTDIAKDRDNELSVELQAMLPKFIWLQKWCSMDERDHRSQSVRKNVSLLNDTSAAIRVQVSLKMILNTLWLMENYYKEFVLANQRCLKNGRRRKRRKRTSGEEIGTVENHEVKEGVDAANVAQQGTDDEGRNDEGGCGRENPENSPGSVEKQPSKERKERRRARKERALRKDIQEYEEVQSSLEGIERVGPSGKQPSEEDDENTEVLGGNNEGKREVRSDQISKSVVDNNERRRLGSSTSMKGKDKARRQLLKNESLATSASTPNHDTGKNKDQLNETSGRSTTNLNPAASITTTNGTTTIRSTKNLNHTTTRMSTKSQNQTTSTLIKSGNHATCSRSSMTPSQAINKSTSFINQEGQPSIVVEDVDAGGLGTSDGSGLRKRIFPSSSSITSSSLDNLWQQEEHGKLYELPLLSLDLSPKVSAGEHESNENPTWCLDDDNTSPSSESLSVGQIRGECVVFDKPGSTYSSTSVEAGVGSSELSERHRKSAKRKISAESSSQITPKDEATLLRRIIRSEMRKFIKAQQSQVGSQSSASTGTTEDDVMREKLMKNERSSKLPLRKRKSNESSAKKSSHLQKSSLHSKVRNEDPSEEFGSREQPDQSMINYGHHGHGHRTSNEVNRTDGGGYVVETHGGTQPNDGAGYSSNVSGMLPPGHHPPYHTQEWPFWFQPPFTVAPPWFWPNSAPRTNDDKGVQVSVNDDEDGAVLHNKEIQDQEATASEVKGLHKATSTSTIDEAQLRGHKPSTMSHIAIQTEPDIRNEENMSEGKCDMTRPNYKDQREMDDQPESYFQNEQQRDEPFFLKFAPTEEMRDDPAFRHAEPRTLYRSSVQRGKDSEPLHSDSEKETGNVLRPDVMSDEMAGNEVSVSAMEERFTIPLLKIPSEFTSFAQQAQLPFKIAWPDIALQEPEITEESRELPLLQFENGGQQQPPEGREFFPFPAPPTNLENLGSLPLLHLSHPDQDSLRNFRLLEVPVNQPDTFPLLQLSEVHEPRLVLPLTTATVREGDDRRMENALSATRESAGDTRHVVGVSQKTSHARMKRRELFKDTSVTKDNRDKKSLMASKVSHAGSSVITVQPVEKTATGTPQEVKPRKRREKLRELNNILRELERGLSDDSDLVLSEVSDILGDEVKYEHFEKKSRRTTSGRRSEVDLEPKDAVVRHDKLMTVPSKISNVHKTSSVTAHEIHSEFPAKVPVEPMLSDMKVGTVNVPHLPVAVQTDDIPKLHPFPPHSPPPRIPVSIQTEVPYPNLTASTETPHPNSTTAPVKPETEERSVGTEMSEAPQPARRPLLRDAEMNTENIPLGHHTEQSRYPRLPAEVYLNVDVNEVGQQGGLSPEKADTAREDHVEKQRRFISVADMGHEAVQRQINEQRTLIANEHKKKDFSEERENVVGISGVESHTSDGLSPRPDHISEGHATIMNKLLSSPLHRSVSHDRRVVNEKEGQTIAKETVSRQFQEMNDQFDVIDRLASNMDKDLQRSNMLLRTIENLNKISDDDSSRKKLVQVHQEGAGRQERAGHQVGAGLPETEGLFKKGDLQGPGRSHHDYTTDREDVQYDRSVRSRGQDRGRQDRPWVNKTIKELTDLHDDAETDKLNKLVDEGGYSVKDGSVEHSVDGNLESERDVSQGEETPRSFMSLSERRQSEVSERRQCEVSERRQSEVSERRQSEHLSKSRQSLQAVDPHVTPRSHVASLMSHDTTNISKDNLKDLLNAVTNSSAAESRARDRTPQKQQELQEWMSKKRKMRHEQWKTDLTQKRESEHVPFQRNSSAAGGTSSKKIKKEEKYREQTRRTKKEEYTNERLTSAYGLLNEMLEEPVPKQRASTYDPVRSTQRKTSKKTSRAAVKTNNRYKGTGTRAKPPPMTATRTITQADKEDLGTPVYDYDIEESGRRFITRKSYEMHQTKMSTSLSFDFQRGLSAGNSDLLKMSLDSRIDALLDDVSLSDTIDESKLNNLDSLLNGDSELRELLGDVIGHQGRTAGSTNRELMYSDMSSPQENSDRWRSKERRTAAVSRNDRKYPPEIGNNLNDFDNFDVSDDVAALLAEAKAAVGDDFSGASDVGDIDWNEVDNVLRET